MDSDNNSTFVIALSLNVRMHRVYFCSLTTVRNKLKIATVWQEDSEEEGSESVEKEPQRQLKKGKWAGTTKSEV